MKTAAINRMKVMCSSMGMPQAEPILKEYLINQNACSWLFKVSTAKIYAEKAGICSFLLQVAANENWQLTINCTKMSGGTNGYTEVYIYKDYWNGGSNNTCAASELYPILNSIQSTDHQIRLNSPFIKTYGDSKQQSYRCSFVVPPGGQQSTFHVTLKQE